MAKRSRVIIRYRSGQALEVTCNSLNVKYSTERGDSRVTELVWDGLRPAPLFLNLDAIESIWEMT